MKFGNCGHTGKLAEFINLVRIAQQIDEAQLHFIVEYDPYTKEKFKLQHEDLQNLSYTNIDIFLNGKMLTSWWDIDSAAIIIPL